MDEADTVMTRSFFDLPRQLLIFLVRGYRLLLSPWLGCSCRFQPPCPAYALGALQSHGAIIGTGLTVRRLLRCGPWCEGGHDPVPPRRTAQHPWLATGLADSASSLSAVTSFDFDQSCCAAAADVSPSTRDSSFAATPGPHS